MGGKTSAPCESCKAHDELERTLDGLNKINTEQHGAIVDNLGKLSGDVHWMNLIGKAILGGMVTYFIAIGYYIFTQDNVTHGNITVLVKQLHDGEKLHYENENKISTIDGKLDIILDNMKGKNR